MTNTSRPEAIGPIDIGIIVLTLLTAGIHVFLGFPPQNQMHYLFLLDAAVYVILLAALFLAPPSARPAVRLLLLAWAAATIVAWLISGRGRNPLGYATKIMEAVLVALLLLRVRAGRATPQVARRQDRGGSGSQAGA